MEYGTRTAFKSENTIGKILTKVKDKIPHEDITSVIYNINCGNFCIDGTSRTVKDRLKEHLAACRLAEMERLINGS